MAKVMSLLVKLLTFSDASLKGEALAIFYLHRNAAQMRES